MIKTRTKTLTIMRIKVSNFEPAKSWLFQADNLQVPFIFQLIFGISYIEGRRHLEEQYEMAGTWSFAVVICIARGIVHRRGRLLALQTLA
ncbi:hypothetical protein C4561_05190 [candidate division WWE3 bacterium]|uniref:Uncharacterized protein n=1 Tax=candidate division WWE3 bacterium TaxID=2053526 RepID=A0A3A4ZBC2_UNCKA|nr:MAG: hypothetical protein C4561_05190 [candidate division WWE3 bacterium]